MKRKIYLWLTFMILLILPASVSEAAEAYLSDSDGKIYANVTVSDESDVYIAVYDTDNALKEVSVHQNISGSVNPELKEFRKGSDMTVRYFIWSDSLKPLEPSGSITYPNSISGSGIELEAEDIAVKTSFVTSDEVASSGKAVKFSGHRWDLESITSDDMYADIYMNSPEESVCYNLWMRCYTTSSETASIYQDLNTGSFVTKWFNSNVDYTYRWTKSTVYLNPGMNHIAFRWRGPAMIDKLIITSNMNYTPEGFGTLPPVVSQEEQETQWATLWSEPEIKPTEGHPRLYVTEAAIDELKANITSSETGWMYTKFKGYAKEELNCSLDTTLTKNHNSTLLVKIMSRALVWMLGDETDITHAKTTIEYMKHYLDTVRTPDDEADITRIRGDIMVAAAVVYDWCYDALTDADKEYFIEKFKQIAASKEIGWPPVNLSSVASHGGEQEIFRDLLSAGVAIYDEYPLMYNLAAGRLFEEMLPARMWLRTAGRFDQGNDYAECRYYSEVWADAIFQKMGYDSIYGGIKASNLHWLIRSRLPYGSMMPSGDMYSLTRANPDYYYPNYILAYGIAGNLYGDSLVKQEFRRRFDMGYAGEDVQFWYALFNDPDVKAGVWDEEPLSFTSSYPLSGAIARTSWQEGYNAGTAMAFLNMHEVFVGDHQNIYTGDFQLYYKGLLAMNTGTYNASTQHNEGYKRRAIAGNTMLCYDPDETFVPTWSNVAVPNDGGQRTPYLKNGVSKGAYVNKFTEFEVDSDGKAQNYDLTVAEKVSTYSGPDKITPAFTFVGGNLTNAYSDKVSYYKRDMVFIDLFDDEIPAAFVVYDKMISRDPTFKKTWLIHSMQKPEIKKNSFTIVRDEGGFGGKLEAKIMLPENPAVNVVGGDNNEMFTVGGITMAPKADTVEGGKYRTEISPSGENTEDVFLHAMYMTDSDSDSTLEMTQFETDEFIGVSLADRLVLFAKEDSVSGGFTLNLSSFNEKKLVLITGLTSENRLIDGKVYAPENGCITLELSPAVYQVTVSGAKPDEITSQQASKNKIGDFFIWHIEDGASRAYGNFINLEKPTLYQNGTAYIAAETLSEFGAEVTVSKNTATVTCGDSTLTVSAGDNAVAYNATLYINPEDFEEFLNYGFSYNSLSNTLTATKK